MDTLEEVSSQELIPEEISENNLNNSTNDPDESVEELEKKHFQRIVNAFRSYKWHSMQVITTPDPSPEGKVFLFSDAPSWTMSSMIFTHHANLVSVIRTVQAIPESFHSFDQLKLFFKNIASESPLKCKALMFIHGDIYVHDEEILDKFAGRPRIHSWRRLIKSIKYINSLPAHQRLLIKSYRAHLDKVRVAIEHNHEIIMIIIKDVSHLFQNADHSDDVHVLSTNVTQFDMEKLQSIFKQLYREWSAEGKEERDASFKPILDEIVLRFPPCEVKAGDIQVLVPGAGLGRLPYEIAKRGYTCQGNEFSLFMLFTSNFVLNKCQGQNLYRIYPWVHQYYNNLKSCDQIQMVHFPDVNPCDLPADLEFSMVAGSFIEVYNEPERWDCIASCFFLDTANNVMDYIETTWNILKPGGYWINLGPLLYHHADVPNENSIEPSYEEIREIIVKYGFKMLREEVNLRTPYSQNPRSMMCYEYKSVFFVCQKPNCCKIQECEDS